jgi:hypothetical protein
MKKKKYQVIKTIKLYWIIEANNRAEAIRIIDDMGEHTGNLKTTVTAKEIKNGRA